SKDTPTSLPLKQTPRTRGLATTVTWPGSADSEGPVEIAVIHRPRYVGAVGAGVPVPLHVHIECLTGDVFGSTVFSSPAGEQVSGQLAAALSLSD
ncbi:hypothetical protein ACNJQJ_21960, partial [Mycobacterium tuberculosis]